MNQVEDAIADRFEELMEDVNRAGGDPARQKACKMALEAYREGLEVMLAKHFVEKAYNRALRRLRQE